MKKEPKVHDIDNFLSDLKNRKQYFIDCIDTNSIQAWVMLLHPGEDDTQEPHSIDEVYYIVRGNGFIKMEDKDHKIKPGSIIFIPSKVEHKLHGNNQDLVIFYIFGGANPNKI